METLTFGSRKGEVTELILDAVREKRLKVKDFFTLPGIFSRGNQSLEAVLLKMFPRSKGWGVERSPKAFREGEANLRRIHRHHTRGKARGEAAQFLQEELLNGPTRSTTIRAHADAEGISPATLNRAKEALGIASFQRKREWYWSLPQVTSGTKLTQRYSFHRGDLLHDALLVEMGNEPLLPHQDLIFLDFCGSLGPYELACVGAASMYLRRKAMLFVTVAVTRRSAGGYHRLYGRKANDLRLLPHLEMAMQEMACPGEEGPEVTMPEEHELVQLIWDCEPSIRLQPLFRHRYRSRRQEMCLFGFQRA